MKTKQSAILLVLLTTLLTALGQFMLKKASAILVPDFMGLITNHYLIIGIMAYGLGFVALFFALRWGELSVLYPLMALGFVWVTFLSIFFIGEIVTLVNWIGIILLVVGVGFIGGAHFAN